MALITYLTTIHFDFGAIKLLAGELQRLEITRPLLVTDKGVVAAGLLDRVRQRIPNNVEVTVFDDTPANPTEAASIAAAELYRERGCDGLVGLGGGSALDLAKAAGLMASHEGALAKFAAVEGGAGRITGRQPPVIAIPTTAGTGSEVGRGAIIVLEDGRKLGLVSPHLIPKSAICDPELTLDLPPALTAGTGMDALAHCIETFIAPAVNPPAEAIAMDGLLRCAAHIERAYQNGHDREARWEMMMAAMEGAMAFQKGLGAVHAMSHPLGALPGRPLHHGTLNAVILPTVLGFNADHVGDKYDRIRVALGLESYADLGEWIRALNQRLGLPRNLGEMGVTEADIDSLAPQAEKDHTNRTNPRPATAADYARLYREALG
jgi:4-hydroxybutyrate dehydrogenase